MPVEPVNTTRTPVIHPASAPPLKDVNMA